MYQIKIYTIGRTKEAWLEEAISEYKKRPTADIVIEWNLARDNEELHKALKKERFFICLDPNGLELSSIEFSNFLHQEFVHQGSKLSFVIGGPEGISQAILDQASHILSLSQLTFTHQITRLILLEQLYRAIQIAKGTHYHK